MPTYTIQLPDGRTMRAEAPDEATALAGAQEWFAANPRAPAAAADGGAFRQTSSPPIPNDDGSWNPPSGPRQPTGWERANEMMGGTQGAILNGLTFGFGDEIAAGLLSPIAALQDGTSLGTAYGTERDRLRAEQQQFAQEHPVGSAAANILGALVTGGAAAPRVFQQGGGLAANMLRGGIAGAAGGAAQDMGEAQGGVMDRVGAIGPGAAAGAIGGAAVPALAAGVGAIGRSLSQRTLQQIAGMSPLGQRQLTDLANADQMAVGSRLAELGPEGMIADTGDAMRQAAGALVARPGPERSVIAQALRARQSGAGPRITAAVDQPLGAAPDTYATMQQFMDARRTAAQPLYDQFRRTPVPYTQELEDLAEMLRNEPSVLRDARRINDLDFEAGPRQFFADIAADGTVTIQRVPNANEWDAIKRALDGLARTGSDNERRIYGALAARIRGGVDEAISPGDPAASIYAQAREAFSGPTRLAGAFEDGQALFTRQVSPDELRATFSGLTSGEQDAYRMGARAAIDEIMGTARNDALAARALMERGWNREKVAIILGQSEADELFRRLSAETTFANTNNVVTQNSATAARLLGAQQFGPRSASEQTPGFFRSLMNLHAGDAAAALGDRALGSLRRGAGNQAAQDVAAALVAQGPRRDEIVAALMARAQGQALTQTQREQIEQVVRALALGGSQFGASEMSRLSS